MKNVHPISVNAPISLAARRNAAPKPVAVSLMRMATPAAKRRSKLAKRFQANVKTQAPAIAVHVNSKRTKHAATMMIAAADIANAWQTTAVVYRPQGNVRIRIAVLAAISTQQAPRVRHWLLDNPTRKIVVQAMIGSVMA